MWRGKLRGEQFGHDAPKAPTVLQGMRKTISKPGAIGGHVPRPIGHTREIGGIELQRLRRCVPARPQERRIGIDERCRQGTIGQQVLRSVEVGQNGVEQPGALRQSGL